MLFNADIPGFSTGVENSFAPLIGEGGALQNLMVVVVGGLSQYMVVACRGGGGLKCCKKIPKRSSFDSKVATKKPASL